MNKLTVPVYWSIFQSNGNGKEERQTALINDNTKQRRNNGYLRLLGFGSIFK